MHAVAEPAPRHQLRDIGKRRVDALLRGVPQLQFPHSRCVDDQRARRCDDQFPVGCGVPALADGSADRASSHMVDAEKPAILYRMQVLYR